MANSSIIKKAKKKIIKELINDTEFIKALNISSFNDNEDIIGKYIIDYNQQPNTIDEKITFITIQVHIPESRFSYDNTYVHPTIEIWIYSHYKNMKVNNIPKVSSNRNDYISEMLDKKFNGRDDFGIGKIQLVSNVEGSYQSDYLYRAMVFRGTDLNDSLCNEEE